MSKHEEAFSLLWPFSDPERRKAVRFEITEQVEKDLNVECLTAALAPHRADRVAVGEFVRSLLTDPEVILHRQRMFSDLITNAGFRRMLSEIQYDLLAIRPALRTSKEFDKSTLYRTVNRIADLQSYVRVIDSLSEHGETEKLTSPVFRNLLRWTAEQKKRKEFAGMAERIPELAGKMKKAASITIGVNLDAKLVPNEALILSVNASKFTDRSPGLLTTLFGKIDAGNVGITQLHHPPLKTATVGSSRMELDPATHGYAVEPMMIPLFQDLAKLLEKTAKPIDDALREYSSVQTWKLTELAEELPLVLRCIELFENLKAHGIPYCFPSVLPVEDRLTDVRGSVNLQLALEALRENGGAVPAPVANDIAFDDDGRILIITGPNQGGKTVYTQAVGLNQVLFQTGLPVPGTSARMSPVDGLFTHYQIEERPDAGTGRFGDEAHRFREIFSSATGRSLLLMNESLSSTSPGESIYIARDVIRLLRRLGCRAVFTTHLHELAETADSFNAEPGYSGVVSMVSVVEENRDGSIKKTYRIVKGPPRGRSFAREIAVRHGISFEQLEDLLTERGVIERST